MQPRDLWSPPVSDQYNVPANTRPPHEGDVPIQAALSSTPGLSTTPIGAAQPPFVNPALNSINSTDQLIAQENARIEVFEHPLPSEPPRKHPLEFIANHRLGIILGLLTIVLLGGGTVFAMTSLHKVTGGTTLASSSKSLASGATSKESSAGGAVSSTDGNDDSTGGAGDEAEDTSDDSTADNTADDTTSDDEDGSNEDVVTDDEDEGETPDPGDDGNETISTPAPTPVPSKPSTSTAHKFTVATWNVSTDNTKTVGTEVLDFLKQSQVMGLQTLRTKTMRDSIKTKVICSSCAYSGYLPSYSGSDAGPSDMPILWNKAAFSIVGSGSNRKMCDAASSKTYSYAARYATWVKLQSKVNNKQFYVIDTHTMSPDESGGKPGKDSLLISRFQTHMTNLKALLAELQKSNIPIYLVGTFNVDYRYDRYGYTSYFPYASLKPVGVRSNWDLLGLSGISGSAGTLSGSKRLIDYVFTWQRNDVAANSIAISSSTHGSDHYGAFLTTTIK